MPALTAVYIDLHDLQSARVWRWLVALGRRTSVEVRPFSLQVHDPWECTAPPFSLELLMLLEQARDHGPETVADLVDAAFACLIGTEVESASAELTAWLAIGAAAGLPLAEYDSEMERLRAEVGYWMAEARDDHSVVRTPTLLFDDGSTMYVQLDNDITDPERAERFLILMQDKLRSFDHERRRN